MCSFAWNREKEVTGGGGRGDRVVMAIFNFPATKIPDSNADLLEERFNLAPGFLGVLVHHGQAGRVQWVCLWRWEREDIPTHLAWTRKNAQKRGPGPTSNTYP